MGSSIIPDHCLIHLLLIHFNRLGVGLVSSPPNQSPNGYESVSPWYFSQKIVIYAIYAIYAIYCVFFLYVFPITMGSSCFFPAAHKRVV